MATKKSSTGSTPVDQPDEFVQGVATLGDRLRPHAKKIAVGAGLVAAGLITWQVLAWMEEREEQAATTAYVKAMAVVKAPVVEEESAGAVNGEEPTAEVATPTTEVTFETREAWRTAAITALQELKKEHGEQTLARFPGLHKAKLLLESDQYDAAKAAYEDYAAQSEIPEVMRLYALEGIGYSLEAKALASEDPSERQAGLEAALAAFAAMQPNESAPLRDYSLYHQGRLLVALGKVDEGSEMFRKVLEQAPDSRLTETVENRLAMLELGSK